MGEKNTVRENSFPLLKFNYNKMVPEAAAMVYLTIYQMSLYQMDRLPTQSTDTVCLAAG